MTNSSNPADKNFETVLACIDRESLTHYLWDLLIIPSPTGSEKAAALRFAELLESAGAKVEIDETIPNSPNIIGRLKGREDGRVLQLAGHIDHINMPHAEPHRTDEIISGRGSADMKNGLAGILEIVKILKQNGCDFPGEILVTVYGLHEAPDGDFRGLLNLIDNDIKGDAAIVFEGPDDAAAIMANGMSIWNLTIRHDLPVCHELSATSDRPDLLNIINTVITKLKQQDLKLRNSNNPFPLLDRESLFVGQVHYGDFYNRVPNIAFLQGTRRWHPDKSFDHVKDEFDQLVENVPLPNGVVIDNEWIYVGDSYQIQPTELIVQSLVNAFQRVHGQPCPIKGHSSVTDACRLVGNAKVPTILCGFGTGSGHADYEFVKTEQLERSCKVALLTVLNYLNATRTKIQRSLV
ncbi:MAG: M20/M25/M40 family metallo-hydrolase [Phycisphaerales bacterium]|jgi:acetylornithine deacetylase/succinyl-diaminopimelate desuccinylase-like protein